MKACPQTFPIYASYISEIVLAHSSQRTPRQKLNALGLLLMIANEHRKGRVVTNRELAKLLRMDESALLLSINAFVREGVLTKKQILNRQGRGRAFELLFSETDHLLQLFGFASNSRTLNSGNSLSSPQSISATTG